jgi:hypothetical protein
MVRNVNSKVGAHQHSQRVNDTIAHVRKLGEREEEVFLLIDKPPTVLTSSRNCAWLERREKEQSFAFFASSSSSSAPQTHRVAKWPAWKWIWKALWQC